MHNTLFTIIKIAGNEACDFLQGQFTCDVKTIKHDKTQFAAYCTSQGKVIVTGQLTMINDNYLFTVPTDIADKTLQFLKKYAFFSKISVEPVEKKEINNSQLLQDIQKSLPNIFSATSELFFPHDLNLQLTNAISFDKGCYIGQEIIARTQYKAKLKQHMYYAITKNQAKLLAGMTIYNDVGDEIAIIVDARFDEIGIQHMLIVMREADITTQRVHSGNHQFFDLNIKSWHPGKSL